MFFVFFLRPILVGKQKVEAERNLVREDLGEHYTGAGMERNGLGMGVTL